MAPERIDPQGNPANYDVRSDVWSFGISMIEISTGKFPYKTWVNPFEQLKQVVDGPAPTLPQDHAFSPEFEDFINQTLRKKVSERANYTQLLEHPFLKRHRETDSDISTFVKSVLQGEQDGEPQGTDSTS